MEFVDINTLDSPYGAIIDNVGLYEKEEVEEEE